MFESATRSSDTLLTVLARPNDLEFPRLGLAIARKTAGGAVQRNRLKRLIRESFRRRQYELPAVDCIVMARSRAASSENCELSASLERHWLRIIEQCS